MKNRIFKLTTAIVLCALMLISAIPSNILAVPDERFGDINGDGKVNAQDYIDLRKGLIYGTMFANGVADINNDEKVTIDDYLLLRLHILGKIQIKKAEGKRVFSPISIGMKYTLEGAQIGDSYPDSHNSELTNGIKAQTSDYLDENLVGYCYGSPIITMDLKTVRDGIGRFEVSFLSVNSAGIAPPSKIFVSYSEDKENWTDLGEMDLDPAVKNSTDTAILTLKNEISARYVRFDIRAGGSWVFLDEIYVKNAEFVTDARDISNLINDAMETDLTEEQRAAQIAAVKSDVSIDRNLVLESLSENRTYTLSNKKFPLSQFTNTGRKLTDGKYANSYSDDNWVSFDGSIENTITLKLREERNDISSFSITVFNQTDANIYSPAYIEYEVSNDGETWYKIHRQYAPVCKRDEAYTFKFEPDYCVKAQYVRFTLSKSSANIILVTEISVASRTLDPKDAGFYPAVRFDTTDNGPWETPSTTTENLLLEKEVQITPFINLVSLISENENTKLPSTVLTDGKLSNTISYSNKAWFHCNGGDGRYFYFDLGHISALKSFEYSCLVSQGSGIYAPPVTNILVSEDSKTWYKVGTFDNPRPQNNSINNFTLELDVPVKARYVCFDMEIKTHLFVCEMYAYGTKSTDGAASAKDENYPTFEQNNLLEKGEYQAPSSDLLKGSQDVCLVYYNNNFRDEKYFMPHCGYIKNGEILDTMFDSFLFLPNPSDLCSGGHPDGASIMSEWITLQDKLFLRGQNLEALNAAAGKVKEALGISDYKYKFTVTIPHPDKSVKQFGDYDGDGVVEGLGTVEERIEAVKWYVERFYDLYDAEKYPNLEFAGWYWFHESIDNDSSNNDDPPTIKGISDYLHSIGDQFFWIPWYCADGYRTWKDVGFDSCCMQPNYAFNAQIDYSRLEEAAKLIKSLDMCIEIEIIGSTAMTDVTYFKKYLGYLGGGIKYGYMEDCIHMYYEGGGLYALCYDQPGYGQLIYDYTYQFIKHTLADSILKLEDKEIKAVKNSPLKYTVVDGIYAEFSTLIIEKAPEHGTLTVNTDGSLIYTPNMGYTGTDTFQVRADNVIGVSEPATITVAIE